MTNRKENDKMKKITIFIKDNIPENIVQPFVPQIASCMLRDSWERKAFQEGIKTGLATKEMIEVIEFVNADDGCHCEDNCECDKKESKIEQI